MGELDEVCIFDLAIGPDEITRLAERTPCDTVVSGETEPGDDTGSSDGSDGSDGTTDPNDGTDNQDTEADEEPKSGSPEVSPSPDEVSATRGCSVVPTETLGWTALLLGLAVLTRRQTGPESEQASAHLPLQR